MINYFLKEEFTMGENGMSPADIMAFKNSGSNDMFGGSGAWIFFLFFLLAWGGNGFGGFGNNGYLQNDMQRSFDNQNLQAQSRDILSAVNDGTAQSIAATNQAKYDNINVAKDIQSALQMQLSGLASMEQSIGEKLQTCCCETNRNIDGVNYNNAINTAAINANTTAQTQKILDAIAGNRMADMQNQINQLQLQNATAGMLRFPQSWSYGAGPFPPIFGGCNCGM